MGVRFIKVSVIYFVIGVIFGMYMGISEQFQFSSAHAHINLLGWVSLAIAGLIYQVFPSVGKNKLATTHFWFQMFGVPLLSLSMILFGLGNDGAGVPLSAIGGSLVIIGVVLFAINILKNLEKAD